MFKIRNYRIIFDIFGLLLFLIIMIPNFIWFAVPTLNDILRNKNSVIILDLCIDPCVAFILLSIEGKNIVALMSSTVFMICHVLYGIINFIV